MDDEPPATPRDQLPRPHLAEGVFDALATDLLRGRWAPGEALPPERRLAERFDTTRIIIRQAVHRLAELGLVRTRQGGATRVADLEEVHDIRIIELLYRVGPRSAWPNRLRDIVEKQYLQGLCLVEMASRRGSVSERRALGQELCRSAPSTGGERAITEFEQRFWTRVARVAGNRIFKLEVAWWYRVFLENHPRPAVVATAPFAVRVGFYLELARRLAEGDDPVGYYTRTIGPILVTLDQDEGK